MRKTTAFSSTPANTAWDSDIPSPPVSLFKLFGVGLVVGSVFVFYHNKLVVWFNGQVANESEYCDYVIIVGK